MKLALQYIISSESPDENQQNNQGVSAENFAHKFTKQDRELARLVLTAIR